MSLYLGNKPIANDGSHRITGEIGDMGFAPLGIDESLNLRRYLNGQVISQIQFEAFTTKVKSAVALFPSLATTESNWQAEKALSKFGQVGKFVIDDENQTIRLPAVVNAQGLLGLTGIGGLVNESLPNITGSLYNNNNTYQDIGLDGGIASGAIQIETDSVARQACENVSGYDNYNLGWSFNASRSSSAYQDNAPVQQEAIQYPYYIQVATGIEETIPAIREYGINTPFFFGQSMYSENAPYNASWLASNGQYNAQSLYPDLWVQLTGVELNASLNVGDTIEISGKTYVKRGLPVVLSTDTITNKDFVVNQTDQTFRLPLLNGERVLVAKKEATTEDPTWYNLYSDGWLEQGGQINQNVAEWTQVSLMIPYKNTLYRVLATQQFSTNTYFKDAALGIHTIDQATFKISCYSQAAQMNWRANGYTNIPTTSDFTEVKGLYYYVGDVVQDASLINAGVVLSDVVDLKQTTLRTDQITNCITEIPQDIKLELNNGTLTLKAGSKVYVPNGVGNFDEIVISSDITADTSAYSGVYVLSIVNGNPHKVTIITDPVSGNTAPTSPEALQGWYDTTNNLVKRYNNGWQTQTHSFPLAICTSNGTQITSIDQVFNGFGYIGSTVFALPGVKGLIPNGRNADGSLRNVEFTTSSVLTITYDIYNIRNIEVLINSDSITIDQSWIYDSEKNVNFSVDNNAIHIACAVAVYNNGDGKVKNFKPKTAFQAVDQNDFNKLEEEVAKVSANLVNKTAMTAPNFASRFTISSGYVTPSNGYVVALNGGGDQNLILYVDGFRVGGSTTGHSGTSAAFATVAAGNKITFSGNSLSAYFIPCF